MPKMCIGGKATSSINGVTKTGCPISHLNVRPETMKQLWENIGIGNSSLNRTPIAQEIRGRIDK
jgi:hypothetical protein